jgi:hypothetical protein
MSAGVLRLQDTGEESRARRSFLELLSLSFGVGIRPPLGVDVAFALVFVCASDSGSGWSYLHADPNLHLKVFAAQGNCRDEWREGV